MEKREQNNMVIPPPERNFGQTPQPMQAMDREAAAVILKAQGPLAAVAVKECLVKNVALAYLVRTDKVFTVNFTPRTVSTYDVETMANKITRKANNVAEDSTVRSAVWVPKQDLVMLGFSRGEIVFT